jgi:uncharacterized membrane protein YGL010W
MKNISQWLSEYGESHQNKTNKAIHWICVPLILWSILMGISAIPNPHYLQALNINFLYIVIMLAVAYYAMLSTSLAIGMVVIMFGMHALTIYISMNLIANIPIFALIVFVIAWIGQFIGHKIEGKKPSFIKDIQFLLIGPIWLLSDIYKKLKIPL